MAEITIRRLGHRGDGVADGPIFAPLTLPGEVVTGDVSGDRMTAPKIVTPSADRVSAPCMHFKRCGGCSLQHASDSFVATWKADTVTEALRAQRLDAPIRQVLTSPEKSRRRATLSGRRTKSGALVGFHGRGSDVIYDIPNCQLLRPELLSAMPALEDLTMLGASRKGEISLSVTVSDAGPDVSVSHAKPLTPPQIIEVTQLAAKHDLARIAWNGDVLATRRQPVQSFDGIKVAPPSGAFLQATLDGQTALISAVLETVHPAKSITDLFAGCGTFALPMARNADVHAVEGSEDMTTALDAAWRQGENLRRVTTETRDLFRRPLLPNELTADAVVVDPPRAGAITQVTEIASSAVPIVAMVSCNPMTFARDAKVLIDAGFTFNWLDVVDQFRWSPHIELVGSFAR